MSSTSQTREAREKLREEQRGGGHERHRCSLWRCSDTQPSIHRGQVPRADGCLLPMKTDEFLHAAWVVSHTGSEHSRPSLGAGLDQGTGNLSRLITWPPPNIFSKYLANIHPGRGWMLCSRRGQGRMLVQHPPTRSLAVSPEHTYSSS